jgi:hypothetical protein
VDTCGSHAALLCQLLRVLAVGSCSRELLAAIPSRLIPTATFIRCIALPKARVVVAVDDCIYTHGQKCARRRAPQAAHLLSWKDARRLTRKGWPAGSGGRTPGPITPCSRWGLPALLELAPAGGVSPVGTLRLGPERCGEAPAPAPAPAPADAPRQGAAAAGTVLDRRASSAFSSSMCRTCRR